MKEKEYRVDLKNGDRRVVAIRIVDLTSGEVVAARSYWDYNPLPEIPRYFIKNTAMSKTPEGINTLRIFVKGEGQKGPDLEEVFVMKGDGIKGKNERDFKLENCYVEWGD